jgi:hypothetical protein
MYAESYGKNNRLSPLHLSKTEDTKESSDVYRKETGNDPHIVKKQVNQPENMYAESYGKRYRLSPLHLSKIEDTKDSSDVY